MEFSFCDKCDWNENYVCRNCGLICDSDVFVVEPDSSYEHWYREHWSLEQIQKKEAQKASDSIPDLSCKG